MLQFDILTIFPSIFDSYFSESIIKRAQKKGLVKINIHNFRDFTQDKHKTVDDRPYGGGPGMILKVEPIYRALRALKSKIKKATPPLLSKTKAYQKSKIILLTPKGKTFDQNTARRLSKLKHIILICGRYEGFDDRVRELIDEEISIGNYVLTGGEIPAMVIVDTVTRLVPSVLGKKQSLACETFCKKDFVEYPQYTRPEIFKIKNSKGKIKKLQVPKILLSGDHKKIQGWREKHSKV